MKTYTDKRFEAEKIIRTHTWWSLAVGAIPIPFIDLGSVTMVQMDMMRDLCKLYDISFDEKELKTRILSMLGGSTPRLLTNVLKFVPVVGIVSKVSMPLMSAASTYAMGQVLLRHFEEGGKNLAFNITAARSFYAETLEQGKQLVRKQAERLRRKGHNDLTVVEDIEWQ